MKRYLLQALYAIVATTVVIFCSSSASADTLTLSFSNTIGGVSGTVTFEVQGLTAGTTSHASNVTLLSYPSALNPEIAQAGTNLTAWQFQDVNTFTLDASGNLVAADFDIAAFNSEGSVDVFTYDTITPPLSPEPSTPSPIFFLGYGPYTSGIGPGPYPNAVATVPNSGSPVPEPSAFLLLGSGMIGSIAAMRSKLRKVV